MDNRRKNGGPIFWLVVLLGVFQLVGCASSPGQSSTDRLAHSRDLQSRPRAVKVLIITMFGPEADSWTKALAFPEEIAVPGLSPDYPLVKCTPSDICLMTTGMGHTNAAASTMALVFSNKFDFSQTYFLIAGIAGVDPNVGTIGSAAWARYLIDYGLAHEIDSREMPVGWKAGYFGIHAATPDSKPNLAYKTEVFQLDDSLLQMALTITKNVKLDDNDEARAYRALYSESAARGNPTVIQCDTAAGDTYWHGRQLGEWATQWTTVLTDGKGRYCTTQQEDNATFEALKRGDAAGLLDRRRVAVLRTGANFDRPHGGQSTYDSLKSKSGGFSAATNNLFIVGYPLVSDIVSNWPQWRVGVPKAP